MDVDKLVWCLQNGSESTKAKILSVLRNFDTIIDNEMEQPLHADTDEGKLFDPKGCYLNGNQETELMVPVNSNKHALVDIQAVEVENAPLPDGEEMYERFCVDGNPLRSDMDAIRSIVPPMSPIESNNQNQSLGSVECSEATNCTRYSHIDNQGVNIQAYELDDIIEYAPLSDGEEMYEYFCVDGNPLRSDMDAIRSIVPPMSPIESNNQNQSLGSVGSGAKSYTRYSHQEANIALENENVKSEGTSKIKKNVSGGALPCNSKSGSCDKSQMALQTSGRESVKKNCCPFCWKVQSKFARHITTVHKNQKDVKDLLEFPLGSKQRKAMLDVLKKKGNCEFNTNAKLNNGYLTVSRRPNKKFNRKASDYSICHICLGTYSKSCTRQHICMKKLVKGDRSAVSLSRLVEGRFHEKASLRLKKILSVCDDGEVSSVINYDWLLISFGNDSIEAHDYDHQHDLVRSQLKLLGRVLIELKIIEPTVTDFASLFNAQFCDAVIEAIRATAGFNAITRLFRAPGTALNAVTQIKHLGKFLSDECIANKNKELKEQTNDFLSLFTSRAAIRINRLATNTQIKNKREKVEILPTTDDINRFSSFLNAKREEYYEQLNAGFSLRTWTDLSEVTMASMILFSRRRVGEIQNSVVSDYVGRQSVKDNNGVEFLALSDEAKQRVQRYSRMKIRGKLERTVPILLYRDIEKCMDLLLKLRQAAGISAGNKKLFALPSADPDKHKFVDACAVLRKFSVQSGAVHPENLRGTKFRKHFATFLAAKEVNDSTVTDVASFMGHSVQIHKEIYRGNALDREIVKMSELLEEATGSHQSNFEDEIVGCTDSVKEHEFQNNETTLKRTREPEADAEAEFVPKKISRKRYTCEEITTIETLFCDHVMNGTAPSKDEIEAQKVKYPVLQSRSNETLQLWIKNRNKVKLAGPKSLK